MDEELTLDDLRNARKQVEEYERPYWEAFTAGLAKRLKMLYERFESFLQQKEAK